MRKMAKEFQEFLLKQNALALAVGVVIGAAVGGVVKAIVDDLFMPVVGLLMPAGTAWEKWELRIFHSSQSLKLGNLLSVLINFVIVSFVVFLVTRALLKEKPKPTTHKPCPYCLDPVPLGATKCRACTSALTLVA